MSPKYIYFKIKKKKQKKSYQTKNILYECCIEESIEIELQYMATEVWGRERFINGKCSA